MTQQEISVGAVALGLIALGAITLNFAKPRLGNPGLALEKAPLTNEVGAVVREERVSFPSRVAGFRSRDGAVSKWEIEALPSDTVFGRKLYWDESGFSAQLSAVMMKTDRTSIHRPETCATAQGWKIERSEQIQVPMALPSAYQLNATCLSLTKDAREEGGGERKISGVYIYWFVSENRLAAAHPEALWFLTKDLLATGTMYPWAYVSCFAGCPPGQEAVLLARMKRLIAGAAPEFQRVAGSSRQVARSNRSGEMERN